MIILTKSLICINKNVERMIMKTVVLRRVVKYSDVDLYLSRRCYPVLSGSFGFGPVRSGPVRPGPVRVHINEDR